MELSKRKDIIKVHENKEKNDKFEEDIVNTDMEDKNIEEIDAILSKILGISSQEGLNIKESVNNILF